MCLICLACAGRASAGSNPKVDSLFRVLDSEIPGDEAEVLWSIAYELFDVDNVQALFYAERAYQEVWKRGDSLQIVKVGTTYGQLLRRLDHTDKSIETSLRMLSIARRHQFRKYMKMLLNSLGAAYVFRGSYSKSLECNLESLDLRRVDNFPHEAHIPLQHIGLIYYKIGDPHLSLKYFLEASDLLSKHNLQPDEILLSNIAFCFIEMQEYDSALRYFEKALSVSNQASGYIDLSCFFGIGAIHAERKNHAKAEYFLQKSLKLSRELVSRRYEALNLIYLSDVSMSQGNLPVSTEYMEMVEQLDFFRDPSIQMNYLRRKAKLLFLKNDNRVAYEYLNALLAMKDSTSYSEEVNRVRRLQADYDMKDTKGRLSDQVRINDLQEAQILDQRWIIGLSIAVTILLGCFAAFLFRANRAKNRINRLLDQRVCERTIELARHRDALQHAYDEQSLGRKKVAEEILSAVSSLKGIFCVGERDLPEKFHPYLEQTKITAERIEEIIGRFRVIQTRNQ